MFAAWKPTRPPVLVAPKYKTPLCPAGVFDQSASRVPALSSSTASVTACTCRVFANLVHVMGDSEPPQPPSTSPPPPPTAGAEAYSAWVFEQLEHHDGVIFDCDGTLVDSYVSPSLACHVFVCSLMHIALPCAIGYACRHAWVADLTATRCVHFSCVFSSSLF